MQILLPRMKYVYTVYCQKMYRNNCMFNGEIAKSARHKTTFTIIWLPSVNLCRIRSWLLNPCKNAIPQSFAIKLHKMMQSSSENLCSLSFLFDAIVFVKHVACLHSVGNFLFLETGIPILDEGEWL